jgi:hypothetical protein
MIHLTKPAYSLFSIQGCIAQQIWNTIQNKRRHKTAQQKRKKQILPSDLSARIKCLLILGLLIPERLYEFGYVYMFVTWLPKILAYIISPKTPYVVSNGLVIKPPVLSIGEAYL